MAQSISSRCPFLNFRTHNAIWLYSVLESFNRKHWFFFILGEPDVDYPIFNTPPDTGFECGDKADGMYSDVDGLEEPYEMNMQSHSFFKFVGEEK